MKQRIKRYFSFLLPPRQRRRVPRYRATTLCWIEFVEKKYRIEGMIVDMSTLGARARPLSAYIVNRTGALVRLVTERDAILGVVRNSTPYGYGVEFVSEINEDALHRNSQEYQETKLLKTLEDGDLRI